MDDKNEECVQNCGRKGSIVLFFITIFRVQKKEILQLPGWPTGGQLAD